MSVLRQQFLRRVSATLINGALTSVDITGPQSTAEPPYSENTDHVVRDRQARQNEAGWVVFSALAGPLAAGNVWLRAVEVWSANSIPGQKGLEDALFPSGAAPGGAAPVLKRVVFSTAANDLATNDAALDAILGGGFGGADVKDIPGIHLRADEFLRLSFWNASGGDLTGWIEAKFDLGISPADTHRLA